MSGQTEASKAKAKTDEEVFQAGSEQPLSHARSTDWNKSDWGAQEMPWLVMIPIGVQEGKCGAVDLSVYGCRVPRHVYGLGVCRMCQTSLDSRMPWCL